ncbi:MAG: tRNA (adenosine(37)-N6)-threonylcarbamoyltransferase complex dimerization subunit type 1 TsaB [Myxococcaceae bacterium]|jgi:tRNA threonylcarbamoyladenosine biosynthesis protein TsaB|nr:tRNA (adenosine(37)-N6)-threonylcarbamoyltransferase complex dimerization subunit type 1 TsaB [Myxococcaceae bacterium]
MWLALDTSCLTLSLALVRPGGDVVEHVLVPPPTKQSEVLPQLIGEVLARNGLGLRDVTGLVTGLGPGSFTGLRIGIACLKGLSYALKVPLVGVSSLKALALDGPTDIELWCASVVKKNELYLGRYRRVGETAFALEPETSLPLDAFAAALARTPDARMVGPALVDYRQALLERGVAPAQLAEGPLVPSAVALARLASWPTTYDAQAVFALEPHYLRGSGAEENPKFPPLPGVESKARLLPTSVKEP